MRVNEDACCKQGISFLKLNYRILVQLQQESKEWEDTKVITLQIDLECKRPGNVFVSAEELQKGLVLLHDIFAKCSLSISIKKTKTMIFNLELVKEKYDNMWYLESISELDNLAIENVITSWYLGDEIKYDEPSTGDAEMHLRIRLAMAKCYEIIKNDNSHRVYLMTRVLILNSIVHSRLAYSCQTWNANQTQVNRIISVYIGMLRKLVWNGIKTDDSSYVFTNKEIIEFCHPCISWEAAIKLLVAFNTAT